MVPKSLEKSCNIYKNIWSLKNNKKPEEVYLNSHKNYWFDCIKCGHDYHQSPHSKTNNTGCPFCVNQKRCGNCEFCLSKSCHIYSDIWSSKNIINPEQVSISSGRKYWFDCHECGHDYYQSPAGKTNGGGCPFCVNQKRCGKCEFCLLKSCHIYSDIWSSKNVLDPEQISISSGRKYWFDCHECGHDYYQSPAGKTSGSGCLFCSNRMLCGNISCLFCLHKSCNIYSDIWSPRNNKKPEHVFLNNTKKFWFNCLRCNHKYHQTPNNKSKGVGCPYCSSKKICGDMICNFCLSKSCHVYSSIWNSKNIMKPEQVSISNGTKYWFNCSECKNEYQQKPSEKTKGTGCPFCFNKSERKVVDYLKEAGVKFKKEFKIDSKKRYDFFIPEFNLIIEVDGDQHFRQVSNWKSHEENLKNDIQKMKIALKNGYSILRIYQPDIYKNKIDWMKHISDNLYSREIPDVTCKSSISDIYNSHIT